MIVFFRRVFGIVGMVILGFLIVYPQIGDPQHNSFAPLSPMVDILGMGSTLLWIIVSLVICFLMVFDKPTRGYWLHAGAIFFELSIFLITKYGYTSVGEYVSVQPSQISSMIFFAIVFGWPIIWGIDVLLTELYLWKNIYFNNTLE